MFRYIYYFFNQMMNLIGTEAEIGMTLNLRNMIKNRTGLQLINKIIQMSIVIYASKEEMIVIMNWIEAYKDINKVFLLKIINFTMETTVTTTKSIRVQITDAISVLAPDIHVVLKPRNRNGCLNLFKWVN